MSSRIADIPVPPRCGEMIRTGALIAVNTSGRKDSQAMTILRSRIVPHGQLVAVHAALGEVEWQGTISHVASLFIANRSLVRFRNRPWGRDRCQAGAPWRSRPFRAGPNARAARERLRPRTAGARARGAPTAMASPVVATGVRHGDGPPRAGDDAVGQTLLGENPVHLPKQPPLATDVALPGGCNPSP